MSRTVGASPRGVLGRADLLRVTIEDSGSTDAIAALLGFARLDADSGRTGQTGSDATSGATAATKPEPPPPAIEQRELRPTPFWHAACIAKRTAIASMSPSPKELPSWRNPPQTQPILRLLAPWRELQPRLRALLGATLLTSELDVPAIVHALSRGRHLDRLPRERRRRWGGRLQVVIDRSDRLVPFWTDQDIVVQALRALVPEHRLELALFLEGQDEPQVIEPGIATTGYQTPAPGTVVLVLGDLGCLDRAGGSLRQRWQELGRRLTLGGCRAAALLPGPLLRCPPDLRRCWRVLPWERATGSAVSQDAEALEWRAEQLLRLVSPAVRIEPGMLRAVRRMLPAHEADAGTEADVWQHPALSSRSPVAASVEPDSARRLRAAFAADPPELQRQVLKIIKSWRFGLPFDIWAEEVVCLEAGSRELLPEPEDFEDARAFFAFLEAHPDAIPAGGHRVQSWLGRVDARATEAAKALDEVARALHRARHEDPSHLPSSAVDPRHIPTTDPERLLELRQRGSMVVAANYGDTRANDSLLGLVHSANGIVRIVPPQAEPADREAFWAMGRPPAWAEDWAYDEHGPWVSFSVAAKNGTPVVQRMRWIPPGRFLMGSPETEEGRWENEGPQHEVTIGRGFWMFETAVTQGLWSAVMGGHPSHRRTGPTLPVTDVSWEDAQRFVIRANELGPGLGVALPSEAQWEYACRARTTTPYPFGDEISRDLVNYESDDVVPVGSLPPNAWGLHEMHGNVWEWCADPWHDDYRGAPADGSVWHGDDPTAVRVVRGGSWYNHARYVRAACRDRLEPVDRDVSLGFRCARVQGVSSSGREAEPAGPAYGRPAERRPSQGPTSEAQALRLERGWAPVAARLPLRGPVSVETDRDELRLDRLTKPDWASGIGRDRFGLFADLTVPASSGPEVTQRLRWIPPGRFQMGSHPEAGRFDNEGPRHKVTIGKGFWLFDTPCTQALWVAVMSRNPSHFQSPGRPVEMVSWDEVGGFVGRINQLIPSLALVLPSEAQWEYACRAGTDAATYAGDLEILGENSAPGLDPIAWYGGNSGVDFDLEDGIDSSHWPNKQYPHEKAGTHPVGLKAPNTWGLYDMLGNVWEWCEDHWHDSYEGAPTDGSAWVDSESAGSTALRVVRGGSWLGHARVVRAACRGRDGPGDRSGDLGFRCARVQV